MWRLPFLLVSTVLLPERGNGCQLNVTTGEIYEDLKLTVNRGPAAVNCSWSRIRKIYGRLELSTQNHSLISLPLLEEIVGREPPLLTIRSTSPEFAVYLPRLAVLRAVGNSSSHTQPLVKIEGSVVMGARLLMNLKGLSGGKMEIDGVGLEEWLRTSAPKSFPLEPLFFLLCAVSLVILVYVLLRGIHQWQVMRLDEEVKEDLARMRDYLLERRTAKFGRLQLHVKRDTSQNKMEDVHRILGIGDGAKIPGKELGTMEQWLEHQQSKEEKKRQKRFSAFFEKKLKETRDETAGQLRRQQEDAILRARKPTKRAEGGRYGTDGLSRPYKRAEETSGGGKRADIRRKQRG